MMYSYDIHVYFRIMFRLRIVLYKNAYYNSITNDHNPLSIFSPSFDLCVFGGMYEDEEDEGLARGDSCKNTSPFHPLQDVVGVENFGLKT